MKKIVVMMLFAFSAFTLMSGCSSDSTPADPTLSGTAATGAPIDGIVTVKDAKGVEKDIATGKDGSFTLDVTDMAAPYLLKVMPSGGPALYSYASQNGQTVNLTPTTNLAMFLAAGQADLDAMYTDWDGTAVSAAQVATAEGTVRANLITQMEAAGLDVANYDLFTSAFAADGTGIDGVLDDLIIAVDSGNGSFTFTDGSGGDLGWDGNLTPPAPTTPAPDGAVSIVTVSGAQHVLNGNYSTSCYGIDSGAAYVKEGLMISGNVWTYTNTEYSDNTCAANPVEGTATATLTAGSDLDITGWYDGSGSPAVAPGALDGSGAITATAFTPLELTITAVTGSFVGNISVGEKAPLFYMVDDTEPRAHLYRDNSFDTGDLNAGLADPYIQQ